MSIEDERRSRADAVEASAPEPGARIPPDPARHDEGLRRALEHVRQVGVEASELLRTEGLKPATLVYVPRDARSYPLVGRAFSRVTCGHGWHVVRGLVVGTDGRLWARTPVGGSTPQTDLGAWRLAVEPPRRPPGSARARRVRRDVPAHRAQDLRGRIPEGGSRRPSAGRLRAAAHPPSAPDVMTPR
ncbi:hypothetical protein KFL01_00280 [Kocuria flava]|uniref:Uncharacterized protein n=1 Tax=Kocuria flava TaxID=446860 RepID=A0ABQ0WZJ1_9MICC|nr:hypothetical protein KFL01_00280 [Kocuria flava]